MKQRMWLLVSVLILGLLVAGCGTAGSNTSSQGGSTPAKGGLKVFGAYATPIEEPWDGAIHAALKAAEAKGEITYKFTDHIGYSGDMERILREVATQQKPDIIFGDAFGNEEVVRRVAKDFPKIAFVFGSGAGPADPNFAVFDNWIHEPAYLSGLLAGKLTKSNKVGVVGAMPVPEVNRLINAFIAGVKEANPNAKVMVSFINSFFDPAAAKESALAQMRAGADVLYAERDGVIDAAKEKGALAIGNMADQNAAGPDTVVTSAVWHLEPTVEYVLKQVKAGAFTSQDLKDFSMMAKGGATLAPFHGFESKLPKDVADLVKKKADDIQKGLYRVDIAETAPKSE